MSSLSNRIKNQYRETVNQLSDTIRDSAISGIVVREASDLWRRDDRQIKKFENRSERDAWVYRSKLAEQERVRSATAASRLSRRMQLGGGQASAGRGESMLLSILGLIAPPNTSTSSLGGGA